MSQKTLKDGCGEGLTQKRPRWSSYSVVEMGDDIPSSYHATICGLRRNTLLVSLLVTLLLPTLAFGVMIIEGMRVVHKIEKPQRWIAYPTEGSLGPKVQLRVESSNATQWASNYQDPNSYKIRIDDQTLVPSNLFDAQEAKYQAWFQKGYPQMFNVYDAGSHLDPDFLAHANDTDRLIPLDLHFHRAHCVLALRRYWTARETGMHVCPRDLDPAHIRHCLDQLDKWAFPEDGREVKNTHWDLWWITQVCVREP